MGVYLVGPLSSFWIGSHLGRDKSNLLEVIHFDVCSPMSAEARSGYRYVLTSQMI